MIDLSSPTSKTDTFEKHIRVKRSQDSLTFSCNVTTESRKGNGTPQTPNPLPKSEVHTIK